MYQISNTIKDLLFSGARQTIEISVDGNIFLTEANIRQGSFSVDRYCVSGNRLEIGSAIASAINFSIVNNSGEFNDITFEGLELYVRMGIKDWSNPASNFTYIPLGYFTVDSPPRKLSTITINALDRMVRFDKEVTNMAFPQTLANMIQNCCTACHVPLNTILSSLPNSNYVINSMPKVNGVLTYRQLIQWAAEIMGTCAYITVLGYLRFGYYGESGDEQITKTMRFSSDIQESAITITGMYLEDDEGNTYVAGTDDYAFNLTGNKLLQHDITDTLNAAWTHHLNNISYKPFNCTTKALPYLYPLDMVSIENQDGTFSTSYITNIHYVLNGKTTVSGNGQTSTNNSYATINPLTKGEEAVIDKVKKETQTIISSRQQEAINLNKTIANSLGLYQTVVTHNDGSITFYYHNAATLATSSAIYTMRGEGFAVTHDWNNGNPVWTYGFTESGELVARLISAGLITANAVRTGNVTSEDGGTTINLDEGTVNFQDRFVLAKNASGEYELRITLDSGRTIDDTIVNAVGGLHNTLEETIEKVNALHPGKLGSSFALSDNYIEMIARNINLYSLMTFHSLTPELRNEIKALDDAKEMLASLTETEENVTVIDGGKIKTGSVAAMAIAANAVTAEKIDTDAITSRNYSEANHTGTKVDLADGKISIYADSNGRGFKIYDSNGTQIGGLETKTVNGETVVYMTANRLTRPDNAYSAYCEVGMPEPEQGYPWESFKVCNYADEELFLVRDNGVDMEYLETGRDNLEINTPDGHRLGMGDEYGGLYYDNGEGTQGHSGYIPTFDEIYPVGSVITGLGAAPTIAMSHGTWVNMGIGTINGESVYYLKRTS